MDSTSSSSSWWPLSKSSTLMLVGAGTAFGIGTFVYKALNAPLSTDGNSFEDSFKPIRKVESMNAGPSTPVFKFAKHAMNNGQIPVLILFGTEYGCSQEIARKMEDEIGCIAEDKFYPRVVDMEDYELIEWDKEQVVIIITSTYGDGVPPTRARNFFDYVEANPLSLGHIHFSVLALGDSSYPHFCRAGKTIDKIMEDNHAKRFHKRSDVDLEDWGVIDKWCENVLLKLPSLVTELKEKESDYLWDKTSNYKQKESFSRKKPFFSKLVIRRCLTQLLDKDDKETIHFEFDLADSGLNYVVGDSLGVLPVNCTKEVEEVVKALKGFDGNMMITLPSWKYVVPSMVVKADQASLRDVIHYYYDLKNIKPKLLQLLLSEAEKQKKTEEANKLKELLKNGTSTNENKELNKYFYGREVIDVLTEFSNVKISSIDEFLSSLGQLLPRYYSISSAMALDPKKVTITIAIVRYHAHSKDRKGVTSTYLSDRVEVNDLIPIFVNNNPDFRLPADSSKPIMMIGPGTGIAPFRAMLQERVKQGATGSNTLYFGCRFSDRDYLYKDELELLEKEKKVTLHTAFSRESEKKVYVQHKIAENSKDIWDFMENGGHIYICGDAQYMEKDVYKTLLEIIQNNGNMNLESAEKYISNLETTKRYQKDTWF